MRALVHMVCRVCVLSRAFEVRRGGIRAALLPIHAGHDSHPLDEIAVPACQYQQAIKYIVSAQWLAQLNPGALADPTSQDLIIYLRDVSAQ